MDESILVVEHDESLRAAVAYWLTKEGLRVVTAGDGASAVALATERQPDLMILDLMLPGIDGFEVLRALGSNPRTSALVLTALDDEGHKVQAFTLGASDYITKPFGMRELVARVRALARRRQVTLSGKPAPQREALHAGGIRVDVPARLVLRDGERVFLAPKEFELLAFLLRSPGHVRTREEILESVWGRSYPADVRTVDVHVRWLRRKLEVDPANPAFIETVRGIGYRCADRQTLDSAAS